MFGHESDSGGGVAVLEGPITTTDRIDNDPEHAGKEASRERANAQLASLGAIEAQISSLSPDAQHKLLLKLGNIRAALSNSEHPVDQSAAIEGLSKSVTDEQVLEDFADVSEGGAKAAGMMIGLGALKRFKGEFDEIRATMHRHGVSGPHHDHLPDFIPAHAAHGVAAPLPERTQEPANQLSLRHNHQ